MTTDSESPTLFSPATARVLWAIALVVSGALLAIYLWGWLRTGRDWAEIPGPLGMFLFVLASSPLVRRARGRLYPVLWVISVALIVASLILKIAR